MGKRVLVTGGAGFIGSALVRTLLERGEDVTTIDNLFAGHQEKVPKGAQLIVGDLRDFDWLGRTLAGHPFDEVYHLAALHFLPYCNRHPDECVQVNTQGTTNLLQILQQNPPERLFYASTAAVYGVGELVHKEDERSWPVDAYGLSKRAGELLLQEWMKKQPDTVALVGRYFNAYGPGETSPHVIPAILRQIAGGARTLKLGAVDPKRDYVHVDDLAEASVHLLRATLKPFDIINIGTGVECSVIEIVELLGRILDSGLEIVRDERVYRKAERMHLCPSVAKAADLGWRAKREFDVEMFKLVQSGNEAVKYVRWTLE